LRKERKLLMLFHRRLSKSLLFALGPVDNCIVPIAISFYNSLMQKKLVFRSLAVALPAALFFGFIAMRVHADVPKV